MLRKPSKFGRGKTPWPLLAPVAASQRFGQVGSSKSPRHPEIPFGCCSVRSQVMTTQRVARPVTGCCGANRRLLSAGHARIGLCLLSERVTYLPYTFASSFWYFCFPDSCVLYWARGWGRHLLVGESYLRLVSFLARHGELAWRFWTVE